VSQFAGRATGVLVGSAVGVGVGEEVGVGVNVAVGMTVLINGVPLVGCTDGTGVIVSVGAGRITTAVMDGRSVLSTGIVSVFETVQAVIHINQDSTVRNFIAFIRSPKQMPDRCLGLFIITDSHPYHKPEKER